MRGLSKKRERAQGPVRDTDIYILLLSMIYGESFSSFMDRAIKMYIMHVLQYYVYKFYC